MRVKSGFFLAERRKLVELNSRLLLSTIEYIDASLWLIGGGRLAQALVMLDNAIEVALKGELERINKILIVSTKELSNYKTLKGLLKDDFLKHPSGGNVDIPQFDIEKTIYFDEAFDRVAELYPDLKDAWRKRLTSSKDGHKDSLHALRNDIVHYGGNSQSEGLYTAAIVDIAFPFLVDLFNRITGNAVALPHLLMEWIYREIEVAQSVLRDLRNEGLTPEPYAIKTLQHHVLWTRTAWPASNDDLDTYDYGGFSDWEQYVDRQKARLFKRWDEGRVVEISCPICDSDTRDGSFVHAQVLLEDDPIDDNQLIAEGFVCFVCGLAISPKERFLARHFVGQIPEDVVTAYLKNIGNL